MAIPDPWPYAWTVEFHYYITKQLTPGELTALKATLTESKNKQSAGQNLDTPLAEQETRVSARVTELAPVGTAYQAKIDAIQGEIDSLTAYRAWLVSNGLDTADTDAMLTQKANEKTNVIRAQSDMGYAGVKAQLTSIQTERARLTTASNEATAKLGWIAQIEVIGWPPSWDPWPPLPP